MLFDRSRTVMTATTQRQPAMEDDGSKHGYFTAALLKSLTNAECASVDDLFLPVRKSVADRTSGRMLPKLTAFGDGDGMFVFIPKDVDAGQLAADLDDKVLGGEPLAAKGLKGVAARARDRQARRTTYEEFLELVSLYDDSGRAVRPVGPTGREKAFERFQENAAGGDAWATAALHVCYHRGLGVDPDPALALAWARRAGAFGRPAGLADFLLGRCFEYGLGVPADNPERNRRAARDLYAKSADAGFAPGRWAAGAGLLAAGKGDEIGTARRRLEDASRGGVARADISLGDLLRAGAGATHADPAAARERYSLAAERGAPDAHARLYLLLTDEGPLRHAVEAEGHLRKGVALRNPAAQYWLGREHAHDGMHARRLDLKEDFAAARELFDAAVAQGHVPALAWSAVLYARGLGGPADPKLARERVDAGAKANDPFAITLRGAWHAERALGVYEPDDGVAMTLISRAASMNYPQALYYKGYMIMRLRIVPLPAGTTVFNPRTKEALHSFVLAILAAKAAREPTVVQDSTDYLKSFRAEIPDELELVGTDIGSLSPDLVTARDVAESWYQHNPDTFYEFGKAFNCRVKLNPKLPKHWSNHKESAGLVAATEAALGQGRLDDARTLLDKALRIDPNVARVHFFHGRVLSALGRHKESRVALGEAVRLDPSDSAARELLDKLPKE
jgi:TPR repeat protein